MIATIAAGGAAVVQVVPAARRAPAVERWRSIPSAPRYQASTSGAIRNAAGRVLRPCTNRNGYRQVSVYDRGRRRSRTVHSLVAEAFLGVPDGPTTGPGRLEVDHVSGVKSDNSLANLAWTTRRGNALRASAQGLLPRGETNHQSKLRAADVPEIRRLIAAGELSLRQIGRLYGVTGNAIRQIREGLAWAWVD